MDIHIWHASIFEIIWLILASGGVTSAWINLSTARMDCRRYLNSPYEVHRFISASAYVHSKLVLATALVSFFGAVWGIFWDPPPPSYLDLPQSLINVCVLIIMTMLLTTKAMLGVKWRKRLNMGFNGDSTAGRRSSDHHNGGI